MLTSHNSLAIGAAQLQVHPPPNNVSSFIISVAMTQSSSATVKERETC